MRFGSCLAAVPQGVAASACYWGEGRQYRSDAASVAQNRNTPAGSTGRSRHSHPLQIEISLSGGVWMWAEDNRKEIAV